jgi:starch phosphorylase
VDLYYGPVDGDGRLNQGKTSPMRVEGEGFSDRKTYRFAGEVPCEQTGRNGVAVRIIPRHADLPSPYEPLLIKWA